MSRDISPEEYIQEVLIDELEDIVGRHPYLAFFLICSGIEFLGICLDDKVDWGTRYMSERHFKAAITKLFPDRYNGWGEELYDELRNGLLHSHRPGGYDLRELRDTKLRYEDHLTAGTRVIVVEYFYADFVSACEKVIARAFPAESKMNKRLLVHSSSL